MYGVYLKTSTTNYLIELNVSNPYNMLVLEFSTNTYKKDIFAVKVFYSSSSKEHQHLHIFLLVTRKYQRLTTKDDKHKHHV